MPPAPLDYRTALVVLIVEDDAATRELYRTALSHAGFAVVAVEDGLDALRYFETHTPSAVVLDLGLPRVPGRDVAQEMSAHGLTTQVPIVVVTGEVTPVHDHEFACVLRKPIDPEQLVDAVESCIRSAKSKVAQRTGTAT